MDEQRDLLDAMARVEDLVVLHIRGELEQMQRQIAQMTADQARWTLLMMTTAVSGIVQGYEEGSDLEEVAINFQGKMMAVRLQTEAHDD